MKFSILTATKDRADTLGVALESLAAQNFPEWEHLVQDGGSDAATGQLLRDYADPRRETVRARDGGVYEALNAAFARAGGDVVGLLHSDDQYHNANVLTRVAQAFADPSVDAVYGDLAINAARKPVRILRRWKAGTFQPAQLARGWMPPHPALFVRRRILQQVGPFDTNFAISADYDQILRLFSHPDLVTRYLPETLVTMRAGGLSNGSILKLTHRAREDLQVLRKNGIGGHGTLALKMLRKLPQYVT